jgi:hypothetical protein
MAIIFPPILGFVTQTCGKITAERAATAIQWITWCYLSAGLGWKLTLRQGAQKNRSDLLN